MGNASHLAALMLLFGAATADAQTPATGAYLQLSAGNQKIARALFEAQVHPTTMTTTGRATGATTTTSVKSLTLDQIAALKQNGTGWNQVFQQMHAQGLVTDKTLTHVVNRYNQMHPAPGAPTVTTAANRPTSANVARGSAKPDATDAGVSDPSAYPK